MDGELRGTHPELLPQPLPATRSGPAWVPQPHGQPAWMWPEPSPVSGLETCQPRSLDRAWFSNLWEVMGVSGHLAQPGPPDTPILVCLGAWQALAEGQPVALRPGSLTPSGHGLFPPQAPCCLAYNPLVGRQPTPASPPH